MGTISSGTVPEQNQGVVFTGLWHQLKSGSDIVVGGGGFSILSFCTDCTAHRKRLAVFASSSIHSICTLLVPVLRQAWQNGPTDMAVLPFIDEFKAPAAELPLPEVPDTCME